MGARESAWGVGTTRDVVCMIDSEFLVFLVEDESLAHLWLVRRPRGALVP